MVLSRRTLESRSWEEDEVVFPFTTEGEVVPEPLMDTSFRGHSAGNGHTIGGSQSRYWAYHREVTELVISVCH